MNYLLAEKAMNAFSNASNVRQPFLLQQSSSGPSQGTISGSMVHFGGSASTTGTASGPHVAPTSAVKTPGTQISV